MATDESSVKQIVVLVVTCQSLGYVSSTLTSFWSHCRLRPSSCSHRCQLRRTFVSDLCRLQPNFLSTLADTLSPITHSPSDLVATLLSTGIRIAQHLNLHRLGKDSDWQSKRRREKVDPFSPEGIKGLVDREVRKRIWCALTTEDWVSVPYRRSYAIFPDHVTSPPPLNVHDEDLQR